MKKIIISFLIVFFVFSFLYAQSGDLLYFCEKYDPELGEINMGDRFYSGYLTVVVLLSAPIYYTKIIIQLDKYNPREAVFEYYDDYEFDTEPDMDYIYFDNVSFKEPGIYRVFMLDPTKNTITSSLIEIITE